MNRSLARPSTTTRTLRAGLLLGLLLTLTACSSTAPEPATPAAATSEVDESSGLTITDAWAKASDTEMSAAFGTLHNTGTQDLQIVAAGSAVSPMELHEVVTGDDGLPVMRPVEGGITVPAGGSTVLEPGGEHLMFVGLSAPLLAGDEVEVTLTTADGSTLTFTAAVRTYDGAEEEYVGDGDMAGMDMSSPEPSQS